jgi:WD40 repeat protein
MLLSFPRFAVTGLALSPDGTRLLSNSMDSTLRVWDVRAFVPQQQFGDSGAGLRCTAVLTGVHHGAEKQLLRAAWSPNQRYLSCGSADR